ncbi:MAG: hypothetical protein QOE70_2592 [Chthoniobacter sp.]|jgi:hypothetical protein|nr:hypothetical protein [Chthoniobacter sp.]
MFWKKKPKDLHLVSHREECNKIASAALLGSGINFDKGSALEQALVGTFIFGMIQTHGMLNGLQPAEIHAVALTVFENTLHYTNAAAVQGVQECINATDPNYHKTMHAILHRGIDGHKQYLDGNTDGLGENIQSILAQFKPKG